MAKSPKKVSGKRKKAISVAFELMAINEALSGARLILDQFSVGFLEEAEDLAARNAAVAVLNLAVTRLRDLRRVIQQPALAEHYWAEYGQAVGDERDVVLGVGER